MMCSLLVFLAVFAVVSGGRNCPTWHYFSEEDGQCVCGSSLHGLVTCNSTERVIGVYFSYCITSDGNKSVVGHCLAKDVNQEVLLGSLGNYLKVFPSLPEQDKNMCGFLNREGRLCGQCYPKTSIHAYTYDMKCYPCSSKLWIEVIKYISIAYVPLTLFLCVVVVFRISVTSPAMNVPVLCCQLLSLPFALRFIWQYTLRYLHIKPYIQLFGTIYGIWNLDFFRLLFHPICLQLDVMYLIALDLLVAVYPLLVLVCVYVLVSAHDRGCRLVVRLWRPFFWCCSKIRQQWNATRSIIDAFATFLLLSYIKFLNTSIDLLFFTRLYNERGKHIGNFIFNNPTVGFMSGKHVPFAILAIIVLFALSLPLFLLLLYPMNWFQVLLNKCGLNSPGLRTFVECFQGYYRDRSDGGLECRYFAAVYPGIRIVTYILYTTSYDVLFYAAYIIVYILVICFIVLVQPYKPKYSLYHKIDVLMLSPFVLLLLGIVILSTHAGSLYNTTLSLMVIGVCGLTPTIYFTVRCFISLFQYARRFLKKKDYEELNHST